MILHAIKQESVKVSETDVPWQILAQAIEGQLLTDHLSRRLYASDASLYEQLPAAVVLPRHAADCVAIVRFAGEHNLSLIPRAAGTSLAGQCVGDGLVVDVSRYMNTVLEFDSSQADASDAAVSKTRVTVQPGIILKDLNDLLRVLHLAMPIDPSTANRCTIGGMIGNNAWGVHTPLFGTTRDMVEAIQAVLSDGSEVCFRALDSQTLKQKQQLHNLEGDIYRRLMALIDQHRDTILSDFPGPQVLRNNAGYALDKLAMGQPWVAQGAPFNLAPFVCGSEGTLLLITAASLRLSSTQPHQKLICAHFERLDQALQAVPLIVEQQVAAIELLDRTLLQLSADSPAQTDNRFWLQGDPAAVLLIEIQAGETDVLQAKTASLLALLKQDTQAYALPVVADMKMQQVWAFRRASLGRLMGKPGTAKTITMIEDCAVPLRQLASFAQAITRLMSGLQVPCIFYGPVSVGVIHLRPELDLRSTAGKQAFDIIMHQVVALVRQFGGTITAKHGDGRVRSESLEQVLGTEVTALFGEVKRVFDPQSIFNPGKIVAPVRPERYWRIGKSSANPPIQTLPIRMSSETVFDWHGPDGLYQAAAKCNGAGNCLKQAGQGLMCPSYMATRQEQHSTRGRANVLRQILTSGRPLTAVDSEQLRQVLDLCLACKGCKTECPAGVDMARLKAEFLQHEQTTNGLAWRTRLLANFESASAWLARQPLLANALIRSGLINRLAGFHQLRHLPLLARQSLSDWARSRQPHVHAGALAEVIVFNDPLTNYYEPQTGIAVIELLEMAGYRVRLTPPLSSGRLQISLGLLRQARHTLQNTLRQLQAMGCDSLSVIGIEPSEILTFRDEAVDLLENKVLRDCAVHLSKRTLLLEEFLWHEHKAGRFNMPASALASDISSGIPAQRFLLHGHCHQKALAGMSATETVLAMIPNATVNTLASGCCGMAGVFGYEKEHYALSMQIGELILFPAIRAADEDTQLIASGASCRQQILAATGRRARHPAEVLRDAFVCTTGDE